MQIVRELRTLSDYSVILASAGSKHCIDGRASCKEKVSFELPLSLESTAAEILTDRTATNFPGMPVTVEQVTQLISAANKTQKLTIETSRILEDIHCRPLFGFGGRYAEQTAVSMKRSTMSKQSEEPEPPAAAATTGTVSPTTPVPGEPPASPPASKTTLPALLLAALMLFATYSGLLAILLPLQVLKISNFDDTAKVANLGIVMTFSFMFSLFAQPIVGAFSDRTRSRFGRRTTWMLFGAFIAGIFLFVMGSITDFLWFTIVWVIVQLALNTIQGPLTAGIPDRFPREKRGGASAIMGVGMQVGGLVGVIVASTLASNFGIGYTVFGIGIIVFTVLFAILNKDWSSKEAKVEPWHWGKFFAGFWISPVKHPDFFWAFAARFLIMLGYFMIASYQFYLLTDYIKVPLKDAAGAVLTLNLIGFVPTVLSIAISGWWSDKVGRRKIFIYAASVLVVIGFAFPLFMPTMTGAIIMTVINGIGVGLYMSVDTALMTEVLPRDGEAAAKDLGILNIANNVPQALSPALAAVVILALGGYSMLFVVGMVFVVIAAVAVVPIKAVR